MIKIRPKSYTNHTMYPRSRQRRAAQWKLFNDITLVITQLLTIVLPLFFQVLHHFYVKEPYHTSILTGHGWVTELLEGHPNHICTELGVSKEVFLALISELQDQGYTNSKYVTLEEQLAIFLYASVTGLTVCHIGERFQRSNETISK